ncbi:hypothetical protein EVAR_7004_1 [Eumeta japonica]|uniref:Uncharacterized protein n=1 Tax=Eumeta variegata TaxID=151549 RepID=A0A4C1THJ1_EUMVA|nr:hypothetical protein EVAR_7004_1 [Eumeta japonica]
MVRYASGPTAVFQYELCRIGSKIAFRLKPCRRHEEHPGRICKAFALQNSTNVLKATETPTLIPKLCEVFNGRRKVDVSEYSRKAASGRRVRRYVLSVFIWKLCHLDGKF